jgi:hypothetical protein
MSLWLMMQEDGIGGTLGNRVRSSSPRGPMFRKAMLWFPAVLTFGVLGLACRKPDATVSKAGDQISSPQAAPGQDSKGAPVEKPADQAAQIPALAELNASEAAVAHPTDQVAKDQSAPGTAGGNGTVAPTPAQAADSAKGPETVPVPVKTPAGQAAPARIYTTAGMGADKAAVGRPAGPVNRSGKDQSATLAARAKVVTSTPRPPTANAAKGSEASQAPVEAPADQAQAATPAEVDASKAAVMGSPEEIAKGAKDQGAPGTPGEKVEAASPSPAADAAKDTEAGQTPVEVPAEQADQPNASKAALERPAEQAARIAPGQSVPVTAAGGKVVPLVPPPAPAADNAARGSASRATSPADQAALAQVATTDQDWSVRMAAVAGLTSQALLAKIAATDEDVDVRKLAVSMLTDQAALARIARRDQDWNVRWAAVNRLTVKAVLAQVAENDPDADIRKLAVTKLENRAVAP